LGKATLTYGLAAIKIFDELLFSKELRKELVPSKGDLELFFPSMLNPGTAQSLKPPLTWTTKSASDWDSSSSVEAREPESSSHISRENRMSSKRLRELASLSLGGT